MKLFQFWDKTDPPQEVADLLQTWASDTNFKYRRFTDNTARAYIQRKLGRRVLAAYESCAVPAMKADLFRYCVLYNEGGIYVDADTANSGMLPEFINADLRGTLMCRQTRIANDFLFVRNPKDRLLERTLLVALQNIEARISNNVWVVTGPGIMTELYQNKTSQHLFEGFRIEPATIVREIVLFRQEMDYKNTGEDWRSKLDDPANSIFIG